ncbi:hypothetical protein KC343_g1846 [Hortaea werneckii]|nr:hypothetical protein KC352_g6914 [Hortaea werneckii]KAI7294079.1 hypothetical protein KC340_g16286 [Hortaea werneckii]KAI7379328.1 hypothetical protein KC328_g13412 [Hortaea werneckii]KAI7570929.1 hypothetical protein KC317_g2056 [Hortaea werneckii]KAI7625614.1 hypothetical protein KC346_g1644 [Hortaea werneckii]
MPAQHEDTRSGDPRESTPGIAELGSFAQDLVDRRLGDELERHPRLLVGNQSSTKRRIVEAACDTMLTLAEDQEFRCPLQITTSASEEPWTRTVKLRHDFAYSPHSAFKETGSNDWSQIFYRPFLFEQAPELRPQRLQKRGFDFKVPAHIIHLEITGPGLSELAFIDLPSAKGIDDGASSERLLSDEENLIKFHLDDEQALILLVTATGPQQTTLGFIRDRGAAGRCMSEGNADVSRDWQVSSQFSQWQQEVKDSQKEEALSAERSWSRGSTGQELLLDTAALQATMSRRLDKHIRKSLDGIAKTVENSLSAVEEKLRAYPSQLQAFIEDISNRVESFKAIDSPGTRSPMSELLESHKIALDALHTIYPLTIEKAMHINEDVTRRQGLKAAQEGVNKLDLKAGGQKKVE